MNFVSLCDEIKKNFRFLPQEFPLKKKKSKTEYLLWFRNHGNTKERGSAFYICFDPTIVVLIKYICAVVCFQWS